MNQTDIKTQMMQGEINNDNSNPDPNRSHGSGILNPVLFVVDSNGVIQMVNEKLSKILKVERNKLIGHSWRDFVVDESEKFKPGIKHVNGRHNGFSKLKGDRIKMVVDGKRAYNLIAFSKQIKRQFAGGAYLIIGLITKFKGNKAIEIADPINQNAVTSAKKQNFNVFLFDKKMRISTMYKSEARIIGKSPDLLEGKLPSELADNKLRHLFTHLFKLALTGQELITEFFSGNGKYRIFVEPLINGGNKFKGGAFLIQKISGDSNSPSNFPEFFQETGKSESAKNTFLASLNHEIRTPLNAIVGFSEQLLKSKLNQKQRRYAEIIDKSSEQLLALVNDQLLLSKIESGHIEIDEGHFKMIDCLRYVYNLLNARAEDKKIEFTYSIGSDMNEIVRGDEFKLCQILSNLVNNAIKFTDDGRVELKCFKEMESKSHVKYRFDVIDTGIGIPEDKIEVIFNRFEQVDPEFAKKYGGSGLGLAISKRLVEALNGRISVKSKTGLGTIFSVIIPFEKGDKTAYELEGYEFRKIRFEGKNALVVDDDSVNRLLAKTILENFGFGVYLARNGIYAIEHLKKRPYDVLILDLRMPGMSGFDVAEYLQNREKKEHRPKILAVTAAFKKEDDELLKALSIDDHLVKPFRENMLYLKMCRLIGGNRQPGEYHHDHNRKIDFLPEDELYDLSDLISMSRNDHEFMGSMLDTFIHNVEQGLETIMESMKSENWENVGETAHRLIPSFYHLKVDKVVPLLKTLEQITLHTPKPANAPAIIDEINNLTEKLLVLLQKEKDTMLNEK